MRRTVLGTEASKSSGNFFVLLSTKANLGFSFGPETMFSKILEFFLCYCIRIQSVAFQTEKNVELLNYNPVVFSISFSAISDITQFKVCLGNRSIHSMVSFVQLHASVKANCFSFFLYKGIFRICSFIFPSAPFFNFWVETFISCVRLQCSANCTFCCHIFISFN